MWHLVLIAALTAIAVSLVFVPVVRSVFRRVGIIDKPDAVRKLQADAVSLGGGLAVFAALCTAFALVLLGDRYLGSGLLGVLDQRWHVLFYSATALMLVGLADDAYTLRGRQKLLLQVLIVVAVVGGGTVVERFSFLGKEVDLGIFAFPLTVIWLLAAINALNLIDGADGMAATAGAIISGGLALVCLQTGSPLGAAVAACLCGSLIGFFVFNRPPATIYLGDAGSMVIGLFVGVISIWGSVKGSTLLSVAPLLVLSLPLFDSSIAILRRVLTGRSIYATDRAHLHHRLLSRFSHTTMLVIVAGLTFVSSASAYLSVMLDQQWVAFFGLAIVVGVLVLSRSFGHAELWMLVRRGVSFGESLLVRGPQCDQQVHQKTVQLQGSRRWDSIWRSIVEFAEDRQLSMVKLDVSIAWMQEGYHGSWQRARLPEKSEQFSLKLPIIVGDRMAGRLEIIGNAKLNPVAETLEQLNDRFVELQTQIAELLRSVEGDALVKTTATSVPAPHGFDDRTENEGSALEGNTYIMGDQPRSMQLQG
jgi:UDP-GlcNAc:undecaprenyl-phosphate/decaprenyl-phosphate GlcNAc-1-phosphate transferase